MLTPCALDCDDHLLGRIDEDDLAKGAARRKGAVVDAARQGRHRPPACSTTTRALRLYVLGSLGFLSRRFKDQPRDFFGMGNQRQMARLYLDGLGAHSLGHEALKVRIDGAVLR
jgi:hypothetical protein